MNYFNEQDLLVLHALVIDTFGGSHGVRDIGMLSALVHAPKQSAFGKELYPNIFEKAVVYLDRIVRGHVFVDGNKRTSIVASARFLSINGFQLTASNQEVEKYVLRVVKEKPELAEIAAWFKVHSVAQRKTARKSVVRKRAPGKKRTP